MSIFIAKALSHIHATNCTQNVCGKPSADFGSPFMPGAAWPENLHGVNFSDVLVPPPIPYRSHRNTDWRAKNPKVEVRFPSLNARSTVQAKIFFEVVTGTNIALPNIATSVCFSVSPD
jgi:hypothetical protein